MPVRWKTNRTATPRSGKVEGQFLQRAPLVDQTRQTYVYAANDLLLRTDLTGL